MGLHMGGLKQTFYSAKPVTLVSDGHWIQHSNCAIDVRLVVCLEYRGNKIYLEKTGSMGLTLG